ncbi:MAG TPA: serine/threonine-protein kinase [Candidatus Xenobia bacterium]
MTVLGEVIGIVLLAALAVRAWRRYRVAAMLADCPRVGRYRVQGLLGKGGMSEVNWGTGDDGRSVAIKFIRNKSGLTEEDLKRFKREVAITRRLNHRNIVRVIDAGEEGAEPYLVMEMVDGRCLKDFALPLPVAQFLPLFRQLVGAVAYAHADGVVHRDLKPGNVIVRPDGRPVILDFGIAVSNHHATRLTASGMLIGTPMYLAPEQIASGQHSPLSDQYALGVTAFELLTGRRPLDGLDTLSVAYARLVEQTPSVATLNPQVPASLVALVDRMVAHRPQDRYPDLDAVSAALEKIS